MPTPTVDSSALDQMKKSPLHFDSTRWAAYENQALDSTGAGHLQFMAIGPRNTFKEPPPQMPDTPHGTGWKYRFLGWVNLETGEIDPE